MFLSDVRLFSPLRIFRHGNGLGLSRVAAALAAALLVGNVALIRVVRGGVVGDVFSGFIVADVILVRIVFFGIVFVLEFFFNF